MSEATPTDEPTERQRLYRIYGGEPGKRQSVDIYAATAGEAIERGAPWVGVSADHDTMRVMRVR